MNTANVPISDNEYYRYLKQVHSLPILSQDEEYRLSLSWIENRDVNSAQKLVESYLRLVVSIANNYRKYNIPQMDLISEGNIGLMTATQKFDPRKGFRLSTYATFWIKFYIQEYIFNNSSIVRKMSSSNQRKIYFGIQKARKMLNIMDDSQNGLSDENIEKIANELGVKSEDVELCYNNMISRDISLNRLAFHDSENEIHEMISGQESHDKVIVQKEEDRYNLMLAKEAIQALNEREKDIIQNRMLTETPQTLEELSKKHKISCERVRQIQKAATRKIRKYIEQQLN